VRVGREVREKAREKGVELVIDKTPVAIKKFNELRNKRIAGAFHTTC